MKTPIVNNKTVKIKTCAIFKSLFILKKDFRLGKSFKNTIFYFDIIPDLNHRRYTFSFVCTLS